MIMRTVKPGERDRLLELVESRLRRPGAPTGPADDFPLALGEANGDWQLVIEENGQFLAGLTGLVRPCFTSAGELEVAAIGSVVTAEAAQGRGLSRRLQEAMLARLAAAAVPLTVLWSDRPEVYASRGFAAAGVEFHLDLQYWRGPDAPAGAVIRPFAMPDCAGVAGLHALHPYRTCRAAGDAVRLYTMPGTRGWVLEPAPGAGVAAYAFCGKGQDFSGWILEWGGAPDLVTPLLTHLRATAGARWLLAPQGTEGMVARLAAAGARGAACASGLWRVTDGARLAEFAGGDPRSTVARDWLGGVDASGQIRPGPLRLAIWGFDSV